MNEVMKRNATFNIQERAENDNQEDMIISGRMVVFESPTKLFSYNGRDIFEIIDRHAFDGTSFEECYLNQNHDNNLIVASVKNKSMELEIREDGLYIKRAKIIDTTVGKDLYKNIRSGLFNECSFAFTVRDENYVFDENTNTYTVKKIDRLLDVSVVAHPAYSGTYIGARSSDEKELKRKFIQQKNLKTLGGMKL